MCADADNRGEEGGEGGWEPNVPGQQGPGGSSELPERRWRGRQKGRGGAENLFKTGVERDQDSGPVSYPGFGSDYRNLYLL